MGVVIPSVVALEHAVAGPTVLAPIAQPASQPFDTMPSLSKLFGATQHLALEQEVPLVSASSGLSLPPHPPATPPTPNMSISNDNSVVNMI